MLVRGGVRGSIGQLGGPWEKRGGAGFPNNKSQITHVKSHSGHSLNQRAATVNISNLKDYFLFRKWIALCVTFLDCVRGVL